MPHIPVLLKEIIELLDPRSGDFFIDGTLGEGGHASAILEKILPDGKLMVIDRDEDAITKFQLKFSGQTGFISEKNNKVILINDNFMNTAKILKNKKMGKADGVLLDLGFSSNQLMNGRGFSFLNDEPLLMTYESKTPSLKDILKNLTENEIRDIIKNYGEERFAGRIARAIFEREKIRPLETSGELADLVRIAVPKNYERGRIHPATRAFMAFRIYVNRELESLETFLDSLEQILAPKARVGIISFNSLEDRMIKHYFRVMAKRNILKIITKKPVRPTTEEINANPRSRSAKLRVAVMA